MKVARDVKVDQGQSHWGWSLWDGVLVGHAGKKAGREFFFLLSGFVDSSTLKKGRNCQKAFIFADSSLF